MDNHVVVAISMPPKTKNWITREAKKQGMNRSAFVRELIDAYRQWKQGK